MQARGDMGASLRLGPWKDAGIVLHGSLAARAGPQVLLWCLPTSPPYTGLYACEWTDGNPTGQLTRTVMAAGPPQKDCVVPPKPCESRVPRQEVRLVSG